ncbi:MAG: lycopene beta-cyclase CrtY [Sphingobium sp.]
MSEGKTAGPECDIAIAGAGLAGGLIALAFAKHRPEARLMLVDGADRAGGNHIWSFFDSDVGAEEHALLTPLVAHRWEGGHEVRFPAYARRLAAPYNSISSARFDAHLRDILGDRLILGARVAEMDGNSICLTGGRRIDARMAIDARGLATDAALTCGWQKFVGQTLRLATPHGLTRPVIMDATVEQIDGYRFVYVLPVGERDIFVEDTYYSDAADLDAAAIRGRIAAYAAAQGYAVEAVVHEETGVLPVVKGGDFDSLWPESDPVPRAGTRAGLFHPTTGYSVGLAAGFALWLAGGSAVPSGNSAPLLRAQAKDHWRRGGFYRLLDTMLFDAAHPQDRYRIFERFYRLPEPLIERFYAGRTSAADKIRILCGKPPVPIRAAMRAIWNQTRA